jgi:hypothetical protein
MIVECIFRLYFCGKWSDSHFLWVNSRVLSIWDCYLPISRFFEKTQTFRLRWDRKNVGGTHILRKLRNVREISEMWEKLKDGGEFEKILHWWHSSVRKTQIFWEISDLRKSQRWWPPGQIIAPDALTTASRRRFKQTLFLYYPTQNFFAESILCTLLHGIKHAKRLQLYSMTVPTQIT